MPESHVTSPARRTRLLAGTAALLLGAAGTLAAVVPDGAVASLWRLRSAAAAATPIAPVHSERSPGRWASPPTAADVRSASAAGPVAPVVSIAGLNSHEAIDRGECLTIAVGAGAAYECGDLRLVHGIPGTRTRDRTRAPVLVYNSGTARPAPVVNVNVQLPSAGTVPDSVTAELFLNGSTSSTAHGKWAAGQWTAGATRRIALGATNVVTLQSGIYPYMVEVTNWYGASAYRSSVADSMIIVSRRTSPYRPGWWVAGMEELYPGARMLWVGGDGSARVYDAAGTNVWRAENVDRPDSLTRSATTGLYTRHLPGGVRVEFDTLGRHVHTITRQSDTTKFEYWSTWRMVKAINLPVAGGTRPRYYFAYGGDGYVDTIHAPAIAGQPRLTLLDYDSATLRLTIQDPDGRAVNYDYTTASNYRIQRRWDRLNTLTTYTYAATRLSTVRLLMTGTATNDTSDLVTSFLPAEARTLNGAAALDTSQVYTRYDGPGTQPGDTTLFRLNRFGAPTRITDALGNVTQVFRESTTYPALVTKTIDPAGFTARAEYDALGRITRSIALNPRGTTPAQDDTTSYTYDTLWPDLVAQVRGPLGETTTLDYDASGNVLFSEDNRGVRTSFRYYTSGPHARRPRAEVQHLPGGRTAVDSIVYDPTFGNVQKTFTPLGFTSTVTQDSLGQPLVVESPIDGTHYTVSRTWYDLMGRDTLVRTTGPAMPYTPSYSIPNRLAAVSAETTYVSKGYDAEGRLTHVITQSDPDIVGPIITTYTYDRAGRRLAEQAPTRTKQTRYDHAGRVIDVWNGRNLHTRTTYDLLGRATMRVTDAVTYAQEGCIPHGITGVCSWTFPFYPNSGTGLLVHGDTATFDYDVQGNLTAAYNRSARIRRGYYPGGMLRTDSLFIRRYAPAGGGGTCPSPGTHCPDGGLDPGGVEASSTSLDPYPDDEFGLHRYGMTYEYDRSGRVTKVTHPANLSPTVGGSTRYRYGTAGELARVWDARGDSVWFTYDAAGRPSRTDYPGGVYETRGWDDDGRMTMRRAAGTGFTLYNDTLQYDARGKVLEVVQREIAGVTARNRYSGLGTLVESEWGLAGQMPTIEEYRADPLGHVYQSRTRDPQGSQDPAVNLTAYHPNGSAVSRKTHLLLDQPIVIGYQNAADTTYSKLDLAGNARISGQRSYAANSGQSGGVTYTLTSQSATNSYYGGDDKLRYLQRISWRQGGNGQETDGTFDEYWYDALGRRVLVRSRREDLCQASPSGCESTIDRTVWAGDQVLYEIRTNGDNTANLDGGPPISSTQYGVVGYTHAGGIDQPLTIIRQNHAAGVTTIVPHANYRGVYRTGTTRTGAQWNCPGGSTNCVVVNWPAPIRGAYHTGDATGGDWVGSLIPGMQDASGLMYRRNRYYNPQTGQFTQTDPIGLAGGLNTYGFGAGDPVTYGDPYGLSGCGLWSPGACITDAVSAIRKWVGGSSGGPTVGPLRILGAETNGVTGFVGASGSLIIGKGVTGGIGLWTDGDGWGPYVRGGAGVGLDAGAGVEVGASESREAFRGISDGGGAGTAGVDVSVSTNSAGQTAMLSVSGGINSLVLPSVHVERTYTYAPTWGEFVEDVKSLVPE